MIYQLKFTVKCATLNKPEIESVCALVDQNPYGSYESLIDDSDSGDGVVKLYSKEALLSTMKSNTRFELSAFTNADSNSIELDMVQRKKGATITLSVSNPILVTDYERFLAYVHRWIVLLPAISSGRISDGQCDYQGLYQKLQLDQPPSCFTMHLRWVHFLGHQYYELFLSTEDLLNAPAYRVEALDDGVIQFMNYENPFDWDNNDSKEKLIEITNYLNARDKLLND